MRKVGVEQVTVRPTLCPRLPLLRPEIIISVQIGKEACQKHTASQRYITCRVVVS